MGNVGNQGEISGIKIAHVNYKYSYADLLGETKSPEYWIRYFLTMCFISHLCNTYNPLALTISSSFFCLSGTLPSFHLSPLPSTCNWRDALVLLHVTMTSPDIFSFPLRAGHLKTLRPLSVPLTLFVLVQSETKYNIFGYFLSSELNYQVHLSARKAIYK